MSKRALVADINNYENVPINGTNDGQMTTPRRER